MCDILDHFKARAPAPQIEFVAWHDGEGWLIRADARGFKTFLFGGYAETYRDAQWAAGEVARSIGGTVLPFRLQ